MSTFKESGPCALRILVVDDKPSIREVLNCYFRADGHEVGLAVDGAGALAQFAASHWDVVVTDRAMPGRSGDELAASIREMDSSIPIILMTGFAERDPEMNSSDSLFDAVIGKPFTRDAFRAAFDQVLRTSQTSRAVTV